MSLTIAKAYRNFLKYNEEREASKSSKEVSAPTKGGLLAPRMGAGAKKQSAPQSELDKVSDYVNQIRKHRMALSNGE